MLDPLHLSFKGLIKWGGFRHSSLKVEELSKKHHGLNTLRTSHLSENRLFSISWYVSFSAILRVACFLNWLLDY
ncbi:hypothetical protein AtEden1_Chr1g0042181 [Arabidopsis thaliana]